jgi:hypothetical protein
MFFMPWVREDVEHQKAQGTKSVPWLLAVPMHRDAPPAQEKAHATNPVP